MEIILKTDLTAFPENIIFNFDELKEVLDASLETYRNMVVTEDGIKEAKKDRASLNRVKTKLETKRKEIKEVCLSPYNAFETQEKQLIKMLDDVIESIDEQTKAFEQKEKDDKRALLEKVYADNAGTILDILPFERIFNEKWLNKSVKSSAACDEIIETIERVKRDLEVIDGMNHAHALQMKDTYLSTLNLSAAMQEGERLTIIANQLKEREEAEREAEAAKQAEKAAEEEYPFIDENKEEPEEELTPPSNVESSSAVEPQEEQSGGYGCGYMGAYKGAQEQTHNIHEAVKPLTFTVYVTDEQKKDLGQYLRAQGIRYEV